jgi:rRNA maturation endonuclease Nob1
MLEKDGIEHVCYECDAEFTVEPIGETDDVISFCPFCGSELDLEEDLDEEEDEEDSWD